MLIQISHLQGHDAGSGAVLVDLVHGSLQSHSLLGQILQVFGALLGFLMRLAHLRRETKTLNTWLHIRANDEEECRFPAALQGPPGSCKWYNPPSRAAVRSGTLPCSRKLWRPNDGCKHTGC